MLNQYDYQNYGTTMEAPKYTKDNRAPTPSRKELLARNSFTGPDKNRHLDKILERRKSLEQK